VSTSPQVGQVEPLDQAVESFAARTPGVVQAIVVSHDGLLLAMSRNLGRDDCDRFAAVTSAMASLGIGAARAYGLGQLNKLVIDLDRAFMLLSAFGEEAWLGVIARRDADLGDLARLAAGFVAQASPAVTAALLGASRSVGS